MGVMVFSFGFVSTKITLSSVSFYTLFVIQPPRNSHLHWRTDVKSVQIEYKAGAIESGCAEPSRLVRI